MITTLLALLGLGYLASRVAVGYPEPRRRYRGLWRGEVAFVSSAAEAMYPPGEGAPPFAPVVSTWAPRTHAFNCGTAKLSTV